jgi:hypothetical protein
MRLIVVDEGRSVEFYAEDSVAGATTVFVDNGPQYQRERNKAHEDHKADVLIGYLKNGNHHPFHAEQKKGQRKTNEKAIVGSHVELQKEE